MTSKTEILKSSSVDTVYTDINNIEGFSGPRHSRLAPDDWSYTTTLWMILLALLIWLVTYLMTIVVTTYFDYGLKTVVSLSTLLGWANGTALIINEDSTNYVVTY